ncbi:hypothetical protein EV356DRAFT_456130 [Viridothelium virens]|uniref:Fungal N-terminal domain-containing protein n=1 Tax=Viridothelium virens TaxID=1048519 RepID=A0A6A6GU16_VIRVR|nr:hypothetical protein EV356DRAFT_456130 [Viridothelium virens]
MSGAEAIFGVVSGGAGLISLSIQLTESAVKLRRIISTAKDAPQTISTYIFHLETMALVLQQLEQHRQHDTYNEPLLKQCIKECQESTSRIGQEVDKIIHYMAARNNKVWGRLYAVYKEPKVRELFDNLERAKSSLMLAYMGYLEAGQRRQYETINNTLALQTTVLQAQVAAGNADGSQQLSQLLSSSTSSGKHLRQGSRPTLSWQAKRKDRKSNIRIVLPSWLCNRVWEVAISQSQSSWGITIHTYNVVPKDSLIIKYCQLGDVGGIRRLVKSREGSLFDTTELSVPGEYWTLLEVSPRV